MINKVISELTNTGFALVSSPRQIENETIAIGEIMNIPIVISSFKNLIRFEIPISSYTIEIKNLLKNLLHSDVLNLTLSDEQMMDEETLLITFESDSN